MKDQFRDIGRYIPSIARLMRSYYDRGLKDCGIGWGQQFFLEYIYEHPGIQPQELTDRYQVEKGTTTKVVRKLYGEGYLTVLTDERDHRVKRLYTTEKAEGVILRIRSLHERLHQVFLSGMKAEELDGLEAGLERLQENIRRELTEGGEQNE